MGKLFWQMNVSLDALMEGPNQELEHTALVDDTDFKKYVSEMLNSTDHIVMGRKTHDALSSFWPTSDLPETPLMNNLPKTVFSKSLSTSSWNNTRVTSEPLLPEIQRIKDSVKRNVAVFGSGNLGSQLLSKGLVDELRIFVNPVALGNGLPMFRNLSAPVPLQLKSMTKLVSGIVALYYEPRA